MFLNDHSRLLYSNLPAFCVGLLRRTTAPSPGGGRYMRLPARKVQVAPAWGARSSKWARPGFDFAYLV